jgi:hypothetical protein
MSDIINGVKLIWEAFRLVGKAKQEDMIGVTRTVQSAVTETEIHLTKVNRTQKRDFDKEAELARSLSKVAAELAPKDKNFTDACFYLSSYWANTPTSPIDLDENIRELLNLVLFEGRNAGLFHRVYQASNKVLNWMAIPMVFQDAVNGLRINL